MKANAGHLVAAVSVGLCVPALAAEMNIPLSYACVDKAGAALDTTNNSIEAEKKIRPLQIDITEARKHDDRICIPGIQNTGYLAAYCAAPYQATVRGLGPAINFYGDGTIEFRGFRSMDYLAVAEDGFTMSFTFGPAIFVYTGACVRISEDHAGD